MPQVHFMSKKKVVKKKTAHKAPAKAAKAKKAVKKVAKKAKHVAAKPHKKAKAAKTTKIKKAAPVKAHPRPHPKPLTKVSKAKPSEPKKKKVDDDSLDAYDDSDEFGGGELAVEPSAPAHKEREDLSDEEEVVLTDAEGRRYCRVRDCDQISVVDGYCRYHYLLFWKKIQVRKKILGEGKLERYIEELTSRYPDKYIEMLKKDLRSEKDFLAAIQELEIDESGGESEFEDEAQSFIDEVRGMSETGSGREDEEF